MAGLKRPARPVLQVSRTVSIPEEEIEITAIRAQGAGGQNVNKVATAVHLRFDVRDSSLPAEVKQRLLALPDRRISGYGVIVIKAHRYRSQEKNRADALQRLQELVRGAAVKQKKRVPTKPGRAARERRLDAKARRGRVKALRRKVGAEDG